MTNFLTPRTIEPVPPVGESVLTITWKFFMDEADKLKKLMLNLDGTTEKKLI